MTPLRGRDLVPNVVFPHGATPGDRARILRPDALRHPFRSGTDRRVAPLTGCRPRSTVRRCRSVITDIDYQENS